MWKCRPFGWIWGLPLLALLWLLVYFGERRDIESDLAERVTTTLQDAGLGWASADFSGRDGVLHGTAGGVKEQEDAIALAEKTWGVRIVAEDMEVVRTESPYTWSARKEGLELVLNGFVPNRADRNAVLTMAKSQFPGFEIIDNMEIASGAPDHRVFMETVGLGLKQLSVFNFGEVSLRDRSFSIKGLTKNASDYKTVRDALREELPLDMRVVSNTVKAPKSTTRFAQPFFWSATKKNKTIRLAGYVFSKKQKRNVVAEAKRALPRFRIIDNMSIARGVPTSQQWTRVTRFSLQQLAKLKNGSVSISDLFYTIKGHAATTEDLASIEDTMVDLPGSFRLDKKEITSPQKDIEPYIFRADYRSRRVTLSGHVPDERTKRDIKSHAKRKFPGALILDKMEVGPGAPKNWKKVTRLSLSQLARLEDGSTMIWNTEIEMRGLATSSDRREGIRGAMKGDIPSKYKFFDEIRVPERVVKEREVFEEQPDITEYREDDFVSDERLEIDVCQSYLNSILAGETINFAPASAKFRKDSFPVLTRLAHTANRCPDTRIEIAGHTDSDGSNKFNEFLSLRRARSVVKYLTQKGVSSDRLSAIGYGEAKPVVPNNSNANKAKNRRIEFKVKEF